MSIKRVKLMRGVEAERFFAVPVQGEPIMTTDELKLYLGDGNKAGGFMVNADNTIAIWPDQTDATKKLSLAWWIAYFNGNEATIRIPRGTHEVLYDMTIPENICLKFDKGGQLAIATTKTLTINGSIEAGLWQIFGGLGAIVLNEETNPKGYAEWFGVDGIADEVEINKIAATGVKTVELLAKTYTCNAQVTIPKNVNVIGQGTENTIVDFDVATGTFPNAACIYNTGDELISLGTLADGILVGGKTITLGTAPDVSNNDVVIIYDSADYSYSGYRSYYRAGEYCIVNSVSENDITLVNGTLAAYETAGTRTVYKLSNPTSSMFSNFQIKGNVTGAIALTALLIHYGRGASVKNLKIYDSYYIGLSIDKSFNCKIENVVSSITAVHHSSGNVYPFGVGNSQEITYTNISGFSPWHVFSPGGDENICCVPNRYILIVNSNLKVLGAIPSVGFHGNIEYSGISNSVCDGIILGGNHVYAKDNIINMSGLPYAIHFTELSGFDIEISGNEITTLTVPSSGRGAGINCGGNEDSLSASTYSGGTLRILNNKIYCAVESKYSSIRVANRGCTQKLKIICSNNQIIGTYTSTSNGYGVNIDVVAGAAFVDVNISNNIFYAFGVRVGGAISLNISNNLIEKSGENGIEAIKGSVITETCNVYTIMGNTIKESRPSGVQIGGTATSKILKVNFSNNISIENVRETAGSAVTNVNLYAANIIDLYCYNNILGSLETKQNYPASYAYLCIHEDNNVYYGKGTVQYNTTT